MYDYGLSVLEQYELKVKDTSKIRGALLCCTDKGDFVIKEFHGSEKRLKGQQIILKKLEEQGWITDCYLENKEGVLISKDAEGISYTLQKWVEGRECDTKSKEDIRKSVKTLAQLHKVLTFPFEEEFIGRSLKEEYSKHNRELRRIQKYIRKKKTLGEFEKKLLSNIGWFLERGEKALVMLEDSDYEKLKRTALLEGQICHGEYNQHNVLMVKGGTAVTNFGHWDCNIQMADLYCFMRKILEKYNWDIEIGREMLNSYHQIKNISQQEWKFLCVQFTYPEKFWKLCNYYFGHSKVWISDKNYEKLIQLEKGKKYLTKFIENCFREYPY